MGIYTSLHLLVLVIENHSLPHTPGFPLGYLTDEVSLIVSENFFFCFFFFPSFFLQSLTGVHRVGVRGHLPCRVLEIGSDHYNRAGGPPRCYATHHAAPYNSS